MEPSSLLMKPVSYTHLDVYKRQVGETIKYQLIKTYTPIIIKNEDINIYVTRTTIVVLVT